MGESKRSNVKRQLRKYFYQILENVNITSTEKDINMKQETPKTTAKKGGEWERQFGLTR